MNAAFIAACDIYTNTSQFRSTQLSYRLSTFVEQSLQTGSWQMQQVNIVRIHLVLHVDIRRNIFGLPGEPAVCHLRAKSVQQLEDTYEHCTDSNGTLAGYDLPHA